MNEQEQALHDAIFKLLTEAVKAGKVTKCAAVGVLAGRSTGTIHEDALVGIIWDKVETSDLTTCSIAGVLEEVKESLKAWDGQAYPM